MSAGWNKNLTRMDIDRLFKEMKDDLYRYIIKKVDNDSDAQDILQNVFVKVVEKSGTLQDVQKVRAWIFTIARNSIIDFYRKSKYKVYNNRLDGLNVAQEIRYYRAVSDELNKCIYAAINQLPEIYREIIFQTEIEGVKQKDLAEKLEMPYPSLRARVQRGREKLKELMSQNCCYQLGYCELLDRLDRSSCNICKNDTND